MDPEQRRALHRLMGCLAGGDRHALDEVMARLWPVVRRFTGRLLAHDADADDAAQEALVKVFARLTDFDPSRDGLTWVLTIASFEVRTARKRRSRRREVNDSLLQEAEDTRPDPQGQLEREQIQAALVEAVGVLSAADQDILTAWLVRDGEAATTAERKRKQRALDRLRTIWRRLHGLGSDL